MKRFIAFILAFFLVFCNAGVGIVETVNDVFGTPTSIVIEQVTEMPEESNVIIAENTTNLDQVTESPIPTETGESQTNLQEQEDTPVESSAPTTTVTVTSEPTVEPQPTTPPANEESELQLRSAPPVETTAVVIETTSPSSVINSEPSSTDSIEIKPSPTASIDSDPSPSPIISTEPEPTLTVTEKSEVLTVLAAPPTETTPPVEPEPEPKSEPENVVIPIGEYSPKLSSFDRYSLIALNNLTISNGHVRGSIWVGGTLKSGRDWIFVDDGSIGGIDAGISYVYNNESTIQFNGRTSTQGINSYYNISESAVTNTRWYWINLISNIESSDTWIYAAPDANGHVDLQYWDYQCPGSDESQSSIYKVYWTDATSVTVGGLAGHLIAPYANVTIVSCNHCGTVVANNITTNAETHINYWIPSEPPTPSPSPSPSPTETVSESPSPSPTPEPVDLVVNKVLVGSVWHIRCDYMDGETFKAGGGFWRRDWIKNPSGNTSKEGHRSNKCGDADNWVIWVDTNGVPFRMDEIKSGATGGTLPTVIYRPSTEYPITEEELREMGKTGDPDLVWKYNQQFQETMSCSELEIGVRAFWTTSNKGQVWYHTGIPYKVESPTYTLYIDGEQYDLVANEGSVSLEDLQVGIHTISEAVSPDTFISTIIVNGEPVDPDTTEFNLTEDTVIEWINELITPPPTNSPTPPPTSIVVTPTPSPSPSSSPSESPSPSPSPEVSESPSPSPTVTTSPNPSPSPSPSPELLCSFAIRKVVTNPEKMETAIFYFKVTSTELNEILYIDVTVEPEDGEGVTMVQEVPAGKYRVEEINIPTGYALMSDKYIIQYVVGNDMEFVFENQLLPQTTPTITVEPSPSPSPSPEVSESPSPSPEVSESPSPSPEISESPSPSPEVSESPSPSPEVSESPSPSPKVTPTPTPTNSPLPTLSPSPLPSVTPTPKPWEDDTVETTTIGVRKIWNDEGYTGIRPDVAYIKLYGNNKLMSVVKLSDENEWIAILEVPIYDNHGREITYEWREVEVPGYHVESTYDIDVVTTITNRIFELPNVPEDQPQPVNVGKYTQLIDIDEYGTALGGEILINHAGDCFD